MRITESFTVACPPEDVFAFMVEPENLAKWQTIKTFVTPLTEGAPRRGVDDAGRRQAHVPLERQDGAGGRRPERPVERDRRAALLRPGLVMGRAVGRHRRTNRSD